MKEQLPDPSSPERIQIAVDHVYLPEAEATNGEAIIEAANRALGNVGLRLVTNENTDYKIVNTAGDVMVTRWFGPLEEEDEETATSELEAGIKAKFAHLTDHALMERMNRAPDFGYDDEEVELTRRLKLRGLTWRWIDVHGREAVEVYHPEPEGGAE